MYIMGNATHHRADSLRDSAFIAGGLAACGAVTVTHGFETVKIRYGCSEIFDHVGGRLMELDVQFATSG
jgi:hypothetical protein